MRGGGYSLSGKILLSSFQWAPLYLSTYRPIENYPVTEHLLFPHNIIIFHISLALFNMKGRWKTFYLNGTLR